MSVPDFVPPEPADAPRPPRPRYRPPVGLPERDDGRGWRGWLASIALHALLIALLIVPAIVGTVIATQETAGARRPRGGGGGGGLSTAPERLRYVQIQPAPAAPAQVQAVPPPPKPEETKPVPPPVAPAPTPPPPADPAPAASAGGPGSGTDASAGNGPGSGGGTGAGHGPGDGSGTGPGTGGDGAAKNPPVVKSIAVLPIPVPPGVRPYTMTAYFDVDERGNSRLISFNPSRDGGYNRRIRDMLSEIRFGPATLRNGTPVRDTAVIIAEAP